RGFRAEVWKRPRFPRFGRDAGLGPVVQVIGQIPRGRCAAENQQPGELYRNAPGKIGLFGFKVPRGRKHNLPASFLLLPKVCAWHVLAQFGVRRLAAAFTATRPRITYSRRLTSLSDAILLKLSGRIRRELSGCLCGITRV